MDNYDELWEEAYNQAVIVLRRDIPAAFGWIKLEDKPLEAMVFDQDGKCLAIKRLSDLEELHQQCFRAIA